VLHVSSIRSVGVPIGVFVGYPITELGHGFKDRSAQLGHKHHLFLVLAERKAGGGLEANLN